MSDDFKDYLGDSVYARFDGYHIVLYLDNGLGVDTMIALEPDVRKKVVNYIKRIDDMIDEKERI